MSAMPCTRCHHPYAAHEHYRRGTNCGLCDCSRYLGPKRSLLRRLVARLTRIYGSDRPRRGGFGMGHSAKACLGKKAARGVVGTALWTPGMATVSHRHVSLPVN